MILKIAITAATLAVSMTAAVLLLRWIKQRKEHQYWLRLTDGQDATEL